MSKPLAREWTPDNSDPGDFHRLGIGCLGLEGFRGEGDNIITPQAGQDADANQTRTQTGLQLDRGATLHQQHGVDAAVVFGVVGDLSVFACISPSGSLSNHNTKITVEKTYEYIIQYIYTYMHT